VISVVANIAPKLVKGLVAAALAGNMEEARSIHKTLYRSPRPFLSKRTRFP